MNFINPIFLAGLLAVAIPIIIHLIKNKKIQQVWLGTVRFLQEAQRQQKRNRKIHELLLLTLRCLALALLAILFCRPFFDDQSSLTKSNSATVVLMDVSGSMSGVYGDITMFDQMQKKAQQMIDELSEKTNLTLAAFADDIQEIKSVDELKIAPGCCTDYAQALGWAKTRLLASEYRNLNIILFTDMQTSGLPADALEDWSGIINLDIVPVLPAAKTNSSIQQIQVSDAFAGKPTSFFVDLADEEVAPNSTIKLMINDKEVASKSISDEKQVEIKWTPQETGWHNGRVELDSNDAWKFDNSLYFRLYSQAPKKILLVNGNKGKSRFTDATYFIQKALNVKDNKKKSGILTKVQSTLKIDKEDLVILCDVKSLSRAETKQLEEFIKNGGNALFFLGSNTNTTNMNALYNQGLFPAKVSLLNDRSMLPILTWDHNHEAFRLFNERSSGDISSIVFSEAFQLKPDEKAKVIARLSNNNPAIVEKTLGKGKIIAVANPVDRSWTDLPVNRLFLPFVREIIFYLTGDQQSRAQEAQEVCSILSHPSPGIYGDTIPVVNYANKESLMEYTGLEAFYATLGMKKPEQTVIEKKQVEEQTSKKSQQDSEQHHWIAAILLLLLIAESFISYRFK
ncbi:hypothetical protein EYV94_16275 [Puteibacter caeruleilacunae]|nr:hypothetical protein EYV94_16275 [Puteibacter caeruleilacunae]